jgi:hypothetical protein
MTESKLDEYRNWCRSRRLTSGRLVQYCGVEFIGAIDLPPEQADAEIGRLLREGFLVDWAESNGRLVLGVWEYGGPEPPWPKVLAEQPLADIDEILRQAGHRP